MKSLMMILALVIATSCATLETANVSGESAASEQKDEDGLRQVRQQALLEALGE